MVNFMRALLKLLLFEVEFSQSILVHPVVIRNQFHQRSRVFKRNLVGTCTSGLSSIFGRLRFLEIIVEFHGLDRAFCRPDSFASPVDRIAILRL